MKGGGPGFRRFFCFVSKNRATPSAAVSFIVTMMVDFMTRRPLFLQGFWTTDDAEIHDRRFAGQPA